ncbi:endolytic transglycosylase MltG [Sinisalibacter aestuarii]|uniref:Endolytic murein transglycosylase n=1 Tax=Sinisalibacter aestuarii TaxID=2949426 RepID=A0ABQ5M0A6_9RHOB|nr:endolytic transglycosylase MltG [Sinisalibacter aestuarii]GKY90235.1 branched-chain alpha-keto acid dehydrogenase subunit E2 [Sinisalibacter aestuarii]
MWRNIASTALSLAVLVLIALGGLVAWGQRQYVQPGPLDTAICLKVNSGATFNLVSGQLVEDGAISSAAILRLGADYSGKTQSLKAGSFLVPEHASMEQIVDIVTRGGASTCGTEIVYRVGVTANEVQVRELDPATQRFEIRAEFAPDAERIPADYLRLRDEADTRFRISVAEGATSWQIVDALSKVEVLEGEVAELPAEGTLAPDSYEVSPGDERADVIARMIAAQETRLAEAWANRVDGLPYGTPQEALIMASLIEKETGVPEERRQVASVFVNRLERGMRLQTDPTVIYGITRGQGVLGRGLRQSELRGETPYNTYVIDGLPPTPIANPGRASIEAALDPAQTDFIFFVADGSGGHAFAATLDEHNANVAKWRAIEAERAEEAEGQ